MFMSVCMCVCVCVGGLIGEGVGLCVFIGFDLGG